MTRRAIVYTRVSTDEQAKSGYSLQTQEEACRHYAAGLGFEVLAEHVILDDYSGAKLHRPGLDRARALLEQGRALAIIVYASDRLTRNLAHLILLREEWQRQGVELHFVNRGKSEDSPEHRMTENMEGVFNDYWREKILESTMRGKRRKAQAGLWVGGGPTPYGYARRGKGKKAQLVVLEREAAIVRQIFSWYIGTGGPTLMTAEIAARLTAAGVPTPSRGKKGRGWYKDTVRCVIANPAYVGEFSFAGTLVRLPELALVDGPTWAAAQVQADKNRGRGRRGTRRHYLLVGHLRCSCRSSMTGIVRPGARGQEYTYYRCSARNGNQHLSDCRTRSIRMPETDEKVWAWLYGLLASDAQIRAGLRRLAERREVELAPKRKRLALLDELIGQAEGRIERWLSEFADDVDDYIRETAMAKVRETARVRDDLRSERQLLAADLAQGALAPEEEEHLVALVAELRAGLAEADLATKRYLLSRLDVRGVLREDAGGRWLECTCAVPGWQATVDLAESGLMSSMGTCGRVRFSWQRAVIFSASIPLDGQPWVPVDFTANLFAHADAPAPAEVAA